jgi:hypothetical protein
LREDSTFLIAHCNTSGLPTKTNTLVQYKTTFNFQVRIELGNGRLNKKWYPFGITISLTQKLSKVHKQMNTKGIVVNHYGFTNSHTKKPTKLCNLQGCQNPRIVPTFNFCINKLLN